MQFVDFKNHLQEYLNNVATDTFEVSNTRDMVGKSDKISVVITALAGSVYKNSATIPYQIDVFASDPDQVCEIFTALAKEKNGKSFISIDEKEGKAYTIFEFYSTPAVAEKDVDFGINRYTRLVMFGNLNVLFEVGNVKSIEIDGEELEFASGNITYAVDNFNNRITGYELTGARKRSATTNLQLTMVNKSSIFTNKVLKIMLGQLSGKTIFECKIELTNGISATLPMTLQANAFQFAQNTANLPSFNLTLVVADAR